MDNRTGMAALAALFASVFITGCGGGSSEAAAPAPAPTGGPGTVAVDGVATPQTVSVVTAKNAD